MTSASEWTGPVGDVWAREWQRTDRSFAGLAPHLQAAILRHAPTSHGTILDIGCGAGATSLATATARPDVSVVGVDISPGLIDVARRRAAGLANLDFRVGDAREEAPRSPPVDCYISRHGVMFFDDPVAAFTILRNAAAPGATLVFSCFRSRSLNRWASQIAAAIQGAPPVLAHGYAPGPFGFCEPDFTRDMLASAGWTPGDCTPIDFDYVAGGGDDPVADAVDFFQSIGPAAPVLRAAPLDERSRMVDRIADVATAHRQGDVVAFPAAAWLWSAQA